MKKGREIISLPVINRTNGEELGEIKDLYYDPVQKKIIGYVVEEAGWIKGPRLIRAEDVLRIDGDAVYIADETVIRSGNEDKKFCNEYNNRIDVRGRVLLSEEGNELGFIRDLLIDTGENAVCGFELSDGVLSDLLEGRKTVIISGHIVLNKDAVMVQEIGKGDLQ